MQVAGRRGFEFRGLAMARAATPRVVGRVTLGALLIAALALLAFFHGVLRPGVTFY